MGVEAEEFVHPERISSQLFCSICTNVVENPVITPTEHLYCENELLDWFVQKGDQICPMTNVKLDAAKITKPGRIIMNMLNELERYCPNKREGCSWTGENCQVSRHLKACQFKPRTELIADIQQKSTTIKLLTSRVAVLEEKIQILEGEKKQLNLSVGSLQRTLRVYEAFFKERDENLPDGAKECELEEDDSGLLLSASPTADYGRK
jgi:hypothetical protein